MKIDWITLIAIVLMVVSLLVGLIYYFFNQETSCVANPLVYGANKYADSFSFTDDDLVHGQILFLKQNHEPLTIYFDREKVGE